jgi:hypothetical protein
MWQLLDGADEQPVRMFRNWQETWEKKRSKQCNAAWKVEGKVCRIKVGQEWRREQDIHCTYDWVREGDLKEILLNYSSHKKNSTQQYLSTIMSGSTMIYGISVLKRLTASTLTMIIMPRNKCEGVWEGWCLWHRFRRRWCGFGMMQGGWRPWRVQLLGPLHWIGYYFPTWATMAI